MKFIMPILALSIVFAGFWSAPASTQSPAPNVLVKRDRTLFIYGPLVGSNVAVPSFFAQAERLLADPSNTPVYVVLSSDGGDIEVGKAMQNRMDNLTAKGIQVTCVIVDSAQSAAFYLLAGCSKRLSLKSARFMMHQIRWAITNALLSASELSQAAAELDMLNNATVAQLIVSMKPPMQTKFRDGFFATKEWTGEQLAKEFPSWIQLVDTIVYID